MKSILFYPKIIIGLFLLYAGFEGFDSRGMYTLLRIFTTIIAGATAWTYLKNKNKIPMWIFSFIAVLFNPIIPIYFNRRDWEIIDIVVAILFFIEFFMSKRHSSNMNIPFSRYDKIIHQYPNLKALDKNVVTAVSDKLNDNPQIEYLSYLIMVNPQIINQINFYSKNVSYELLPSVVSTIFTKSSFDNLSKVTLSLVTNGYQGSDRSDAEKQELLYTSIASEFALLLDANSILAYLTLSRLNIALENFDESKKWCIEGLDKIEKLSFQNSPLSKFDLTLEEIKEKLLSDLEEIENEIKQ